MPRPVGNSLFSEISVSLRQTNNPITQVLKLEPELNAGGGTSDGRFMAPLGTEVVELGLLNTSIHQVDEHTPTDDLDALAQVYKRILMQIFSGGQ